MNQKHGMVMIRHVMDCSQSEALDGDDYRHVCYQTLESKFQFVKAVAIKTDVKLRWLNE